MNRQTVEAATAAHLTYHAIERVADVDRPEDLPVWYVEEFVIEASKLTSAGTKPKNELPRKLTQTN